MSGLRRWILVWLGLILSPLGVGCHQGTYRAATLPASLQAPPTVNVRNLDLSRLASGQHDSVHLQPGDKLELQIVTGSEADRKEPWPVVVAEDGTVEIPYVGDIRLAGMDLQQAQQAVREISIQRGIYLRPTVYLTRKAQRTNRVTVSGAVEKPGTYDLPVNSSDLLSAIVAAGGLKDTASTTVKIQRSSRTVAVESQNLVAQVGYQEGSPVQGQIQELQIDLASVTLSPKRQPVLVQDGDVVVVVEQSPRYVHVLGLVRSPGQYELPTGQDVRLLDALAMAGGASLSIADKMIVLREQPGSTQPLVIEVSLSKAKKGEADNLLLAHRDVVSVEETPVTFVVGAIREMIRIGVNGGVGF